MPTVTISLNSGLDRLYQSIKADLADRYHQPGNSFPNITLSPSELVDQAALSSFAAHASDNLHVEGVHIERLIT